MKSPKVMIPLLTLVFTAVWFPAAAWAEQSILITIDDSDASAVTVAATTNGAVASDASHHFNEGIVFTNFFTTAPTNFASDVTATGLTTFLDGAPEFDTFNSDDLASSAAVDLQIYALFTAGASTTFMHFEQGTQAFTSQIVLDLSAISSQLPAVGAIGDIYAGYYFDLGSALSGSSRDGGPTTSVITTQVLIGQYLVVPEPGPGILMLAGGAILGLTVWRSRKRVLQAAGR